MLSMMCCSFVVTAEFMHFIKEAIPKLIGFLENDNSDLRSKGATVLAELWGQG